MDYSSNTKWWTRETVAVVTGANKGIGYQIVRQLAEKELTVILTARDVNRGLTAAKILEEEGLQNVVFRQLDIQSPHSVSAFASWLKDNYGGLDILINNAGVVGFVVNTEAAIDAGMTMTAKDDIFDNPNYAHVFQANYEMSKNCVETNYYGTKRITQALLPLFRPSPAGARIVTVSSQAGLLEFLKNDSLRRELSDVSKLTEESIDQMLQNFLDDVKSGEFEVKGWPYAFPQYSLSKLASNAYTRMLSRRLSESESENKEGRRISVNSVHPGKVKTDMSSNEGDLTASEGAESCVMVALLPPGGPSGQFYFMKNLHHF